MPFKLIGLDYDGTLVDTYRFHTLTIHHVLVESGSTISVEEMQKLMGLNLKHIFDNALPPDKWELCQQNMSRLYNNMPEKFWAEVRVFENVRTVLDTLYDKGYPMGLVTNSQIALVRASLEHFGLGKYFKWVIAEDAATSGKEERLRLLLEKSGYRAEDCLFIGDNDSDITDCQAVGIKGCLVDNKHSWIRLKSKLPEGFAPDYRVEDISQVLDIIL